MPNSGSSRNSAVALPIGPSTRLMSVAVWLNEEAVRLYWRERAAPPLTPQVIVVERPVDTTSYVTDSTIRVKEDTVAAVVDGLRGILDWLDNDMPLSTASSGSSAKWDK